ncbi:MAG: hypothetical protein WCK51_12270 [Armatimonadota bacterium]
MFVGVFLVTSALQLVGCTKPCRIVLVNGMAAPAAVTVDNGGSVTIPGFGQALLTGGKTLRVGQNFKMEINRGGRKTSQEVDQVNWSADRYDDLLVVVLRE